MMLLRSLAIRPQLVLQLALLLAASLLVGPVRAEDNGRDLAAFELVIGDTGAALADWELNPARVYAEVSSSSEGLYFTGLASAFFVLRERFGDPVPMRQLLVADYASDGAAQLLDAREAWYFWDSERLAIGGLPLILAFASKAEARSMARVHTGSVLSFATLTDRLRGWCGTARPRTAWRGDFSWGEERWQQAWHTRWDGWINHHDFGWCDGRLLDSGHWPGLQQHSRHDRYSGERHWREEERRHEREREQDEQRVRQRERERREQEQRERERREREEREQGERERERERNRPGQGSDKGTHDPHFGKERQDGGKPAPPPPPPPAPKPEPPAKEVKPEQQEDKAEPAPPPPPAKGTNDPKKDG